LPEYFDVEVMTTGARVSKDRCQREDDTPAAVTPGTAHSAAPFAAPEAMSPAPPDDSLQAHVTGGVDASILWDNRRRSVDFTGSHNMATIELAKYLRSHNQEYHACLEACVECLVACEMCSDACLDEENIGMMLPCIRLDRDCADACALAVRMMSRGGPLAKDACRACAEACAACAAECERHAASHDHCRICAEACRRCEVECRRMAGVTT
jgi:hypothetical protein